MKKIQLLSFNTVVKSLKIFLFLSLISQLTFAQQGHLDFSFNSSNGSFGEGANGMVQTSAIQADGKIIIGGYFTSYNGKAVNRVARLNPDGILDNTFNLGDGPSGEVLSISIQSDGKVIIAGSFTSFNGTKANRIARLNADGTLDNTFNSGDGANSTVLTTALQSDGKIIIGGAFFTYNGVTMNRIARLNADGSLDSSFDIGTGADDYGFQNDYVRTISIQNDGKIIIGGDFTSYNGISVNQIARLNVDGTLDDSFNLDQVLSGSLETSNIQNDGKIVIGGLFTYGIDYTGIIRFNTDGSIDNSFNGDNVIIRSIAIQNDGKIIIGGSFDTYSGVSTNDLARLNADGTLDETFDVGIGAEFGEIRTTCIQNDGNIIIGGSFTSYNGSAINRVARLLGECTPLQPSTITGNTTACQGTSETYSVDYVAGVTYNWNIPEDWVGSSTSNSITAIVGNIGGIISVTTNYVCGSSSEQTLEVEVPLLDNSVNVNGNHITANQSDAIYQWINCNNAFEIIEGETSQSFTATGNGSFAVIITQSLCSDTSLCIPITITGISTIPDYSASVYPNPFSEKLIIDIEGDKVGVNFELINSLGNVISEGILNRKTTVSTLNYAAGVYFIKFENDKIIEFKRIIKY
jgi:uncharacterized delta-60 repeat protein